MGALSTASDDPECGKKQQQTAGSDLDLTPAPATAAPCQYQCHWQQVLGVNIPINNQQQVFILNKAKKQKHHWG